MKGWDQSSINAYEARQLSKRLPAMRDTAEKESDLHEQILAEVRRRGWIAFHSRMDVPTTSNIGMPDFVILAEGGRVLLIEAKSRTGKLSTAQLALHAWASRLSHQVHTVRSFSEFLGAINAK